MPQDSMPWTGTPLTDVGDVGPYTYSEWTRIWAQCWGPKDRANVGVVEGVLGEYEVTGAISPVTVVGGAALVQGTYHINTSPITVAVPTPSVGNSRADLIILQKDVTAQTVRIVRLAGTEAASPAEPTLTQVDASIWEIPLARLTINDVGTITIGDRRVWFDVPLILGGLLSARPAAGKVGRFYVSSDANEIFYDSGSAWVSQGFTSQLNAQVFIVSDVWTKPPEITWVFVQAVGGGGFGAPGDAGASGGGGGGGEVVEGLFPASAVPTTLSVTVAGPSGNSAVIGAAFELTAHGGANGTTSGPGGPWRGSRDAGFRGSRVSAGSRWASRGSRESGRTSGVGRGRRLWSV